MSYDQGHAQTGDGPPSPPLPGQLNEDHAQAEDDAPAVPPLPGRVNEGKPEPLVPRPPPRSRQAQLEKLAVELGLRAETLATQTELNLTHNQLTQLPPQIEH
eukprot:COSAG02_NODE_25530_length_656_cov_0.874327_1_plen_101_part_01